MEELIVVRIMLGGMGVFLVGQAGMLIWHLSRMNTTLAFIRIDLEKAMAELEKKDGKRDAEIMAIWKRIDENRSRIVSVEEKVKNLSGK